MQRRAFRLPGFAVVGLMLLVIGGAVVGALATANANPDSPGWPLVLILVMGAVLLLLVVTGLAVVNPNQALIVQFFGKYAGTIDQPGFWYTLPFSTRRNISMRVRNFETAQSKVNDADGNPVEIAAVIVWRVTDPAKAVFSVDSYISYVAIQSETALRHLATCYPYDAHGTERMSLRDGAQVAEELSRELRERVAVAGVEVLESRITHLAYAPEIAQAMLRRQQASAVVAARKEIVAGAVGMVHMALDHIAEQELVNLDEERKATMVSNLLVVLCSEQGTQPVVNAGSLYS